MLIHVIATVKYHPTPRDKDNLSQAWRLCETASAAVSRKRDIPAAPLAVWQHQSEPEGLTDLLNLSHNALDTQDEENESFHLT